MYCWGDNAYSTVRATWPWPRQFLGGPHSPCGVWRDRSDNGRSTHLRLFSNGTVACWGQNINGELGLGFIPVESDGRGCSCVPSVSLVPTLTTAVAISAGDYHTCAVISGGTLSCWGWNSVGQLGYGYPTDSYSPAAVSGISNVLGVACGVYHTCVLTTSGGISCWGGGSDGQLGNGGTGEVHSPPAPFLPSITGILTAISAGPYHSCALSSVGGVYCWGRISAEIPQGSWDWGLRPPQAYLLYPPRVPQ